MTRVTLISHSDTFYSTRRLLTAGADLGLAMSRVDPVRVLVELHGDRPRLTEGVVRSLTNAAGRGEKVKIARRIR